MSHFSTVKLKLRDLETLLSALRFLGLRVEEHGRVKGWNGGAQTCDVATGKTDLVVGFNLRGDSGAYEMVSDWNYVAKASMGAQDAFLNGLNQAYAREATIQTLTAQGYTVADERNENGELCLVLNRW